MKTLLKMPDKILLAALAGFAVVLCVMGWSYLTLLDNSPSPTSKEELRSLILLSASLLLALGLGLRLVWSHQQRRYELEAHRQAEEVLRQSEERFRSFTAASFEGISISENGLLLDVSDRYAAMFGYSREELVGRPVLSVVAPESRETVSAAIALGSEQVYEHLALRKDGSVFTVEVQARMLLWKGKATRFSAVRDITERKRAEAELKQAHEELVQASRAAGMAELATSVLHNVGNVLNSVNVSTSLVLEQVQKSRAANVARVAALMRENAANLGEFITQDPKGRHLPGYLDELAKHIEREHATLLEELHSLKASVEHIKDIITMQQSCARTVGASEEVSVAGLVEDALRMNADSLEKHGIQVSRDYAPHVPVIRAEKHKALQILMNLIRNAQHACGGASSSRLTLTVKNGGEFVRIAVADNGSGIAPENLPRIFTRGFTTKKDGHGFGLHSSQAAAREMGGELRAHSDGPGRGAVFTLELPVRAAPPEAPASPGPA